MSFGSLTGPLEITGALPNRLRSVGYMVSIRFQTRFRTLYFESSDTEVQAV